ncbi:MAG: putative 2OG-Fe(II) oxygenase [Gemmataceae bacterium]
MLVEHHTLFPTRLVSVQFPDVAGLNAELVRFFAEHAAGGAFDMHPDTFNLLRLGDRLPAVGRLRELFRRGLRAWLDAEGAAPPSADVVLFSNYSSRGDFTSVHNHNADVVAVYYAQTAAHDRPAVLVPGDDDEYFAAEDGALLLHDPRFNANLAAVGVRDYVKVFPRPGLMVLFPGYVWHSVTPHQGDRERLAVSANFRLRWRESDNAERWSL